MLWRRRRKEGLNLLAGLGVPQYPSRTTAGVAKVQVPLVPTQAWIGWMNGWNIFSNICSNGLKTCSSFTFTLMFLFLSFFLPFLNQNDYCSLIFMGSQEQNWLAYTFCDGQQISWDFTCENEIEIGNGRSPLQVCVCLKYTNTLQFGE